MCRCVCVREEGSHPFFVLLAFFLATYALSTLGCCTYAVHSEEKLNNVAGKVKDDW